MKRGVSKRLRFEIFKRDGFVCQYCGRRPPDVVLEVDHIHPRAAGGTNDICNLVTACADCNRGKGPGLLREIPARPDADLAYLEAQQEIAEARRYLESKEERKRLSGSVVAELRDCWRISFDDYTEPPSEKVFLRWFSDYCPEEIEYAIGRTAGRQRAHKLSRYLPDLIAYASAILRNRRAESGHE
jgi:hypothetical protein